MKNYCFLAILSFALFLIGCGERFPNKTKSLRTVTKMLHLKDAADRFREVNGVWPEDQKSLHKPPELNGKAQDKFISKIMKDAWGRIIIQELGEHQEPVYVSYGSDGRLGGTGANADIRFSVIDGREGD